MLVTLQANPDDGIFTSGVYRATALDAAFPQEKTRVVALPCAGRSENALKHRFPENPNP
jgi:hypothetical protein